LWLFLLGIDRISFKFLPASAGTGYPPLRTRKGSSPAAEVWIGVVPSSRHSPTASTLLADPSVRNKTVALRMLDPVLRECERLPVARVVLPECH
jgi:hypothetical protein